MIIKNRKEFKPKIMDNEQMKGVKFYPLITAKDGAPNFALRIFEVAPNGYSPKHTHDWEHEIFIAEGEGKAISKDGEFRIGKGDCLFVKPSELHQIRAGDKGITFVCIVPNKGQPT